MFERFNATDRAFIHAIYHEVHKMAVDYSKLSDAITQLQADNVTLISIANRLLANQPDPTAQAVVDALTQRVTGIDATDVAAIATLSATGPSGSTGPAGGSTGATGPDAGTTGATGPDGASGTAAPAA